MTVRHIVIVGSGALAHSLCWSLATGLGPPSTGREPASLTVLARDADAALELARSTRLRAAVWGSALTVTGAALTTGTRAGAAPDDPRAVLERLRPDLLVCCASDQSPYERTTRPSAWTDLIARAGFGVTLPLQATVVAPLARALAEVSPGTALVNGCFPDAVNPLLTALGLPVLCGIGNVATLAACLQASLSLPDQRRLAVLGHHSQLGGPADGRDVLAWCDGVAVTDVTARLARDRARPRRELNDVAGHAAAHLVAGLVRGLDIHTSVPGPLGLPGGYPVRIDPAGELTLDLPAGLSRSEAVDINRRAGRADGVDVHDGQVDHAPATVDALTPVAPDLATGWAVTDLDEVTRHLTALRQHLRAAPPVAV